MENSILLSRCAVISLPYVFFTSLRYFISRHKKTLGAALKILCIEGWPMEKEIVKSWPLQQKGEIDHSQTDSGPSPFRIQPHILMPQKNELRTSFTSRLICKVLEAPASAGPESERHPPFPKKQIPEHNQPNSMDYTRAALVCQWAASLVIYKALIFPAQVMAFHRPLLPLPSSYLQNVGNASNSSLKKVDTWRSISGLRNYPRLTSLRRSFYGPFQHYHYQNLLQLQEVHTNTRKSRVTLRIQPKSFPSGKVNWQVCLEWTIRDNRTKDAIHTVSLQTAVGMDSPHLRIRKD